LLNRNGANQPSPQVLRTPQGGEQGRASSLSSLPSGRQEEGSAPPISGWPGRNHGSPGLSWCRGRIQASQTARFSPEPTGSLATSSPGQPEALSLPRPRGLSHRDGHRCSPGLSRVDHRIGTLGCLCSSDAFLSVIPRTSWVISESSFPPGQLRRPLPAARARAQSQSHSQSHQP
jgi:hypothetical protein